MKIKQRTHVTVVTHEITLLRIQNEAASTEFSGDPATTPQREPHPDDGSQTEIDPKENKYETEELNSYFCRDRNSLTNS